MQLQDKVAIVTGAASGFGEAIAKRFAAEGAKVVVDDINAAGGERVEVRSGDVAAPMKADIRVPHVVADDEQDIGPAIGCGQRCRYGAALAGNG